MGFALSPSVTVKEIDLSTIIPAVATTNAGFVGVFPWGPVDTRVLLSSEDDLTRTFGEPDANTYKFFFQAANFLAYGNNLRVVRAATGNLNATSENTTGGAGTGAGLLVKNEDHYNANYADGSANSGIAVAKYPGTKGNSLQIAVCPSAAVYSSTLTGNITMASVGLTTVTGSGTAFDTEVKVGDLIELRHATPNAYQYLRVTAVGSATSMTVTSIDTGVGTERGNLAIVTTQTSTIRKWGWHDQFDAAPGSSDFAKNSGSTTLNDEMHVVIVDEDGVWSGTKRTILEKFAYLSKASDAKTSAGGSNYYVDVLNSTSAYMWWTDHVATANWGTSTIVRQAAGSAYTATTLNTFSFAGGTDDNAPTDGELQTGYLLFADPETVDVSLIIGCPTETVVGTVNNWIIDNILEVRKDCVGFISPQESDVVNNDTYPGKEADALVTYANTTITTRSSYCVLDGSYKKQYDRYNDVFRNIALAGDVAGLCARTDDVADPWFSPAGFNRGGIKNATKLMFNPNRAERDNMYRAGVNPVTAFAGQGITLFGDKTMLNRPSAFDRINVRRLFIVLEKAIATASKFTLFEFNDEFTRSQFVNLVEPFLRDVQGRRGIIDFKVVCNESNNTGEVIDRNEFVADIFIKPARSINFISLNFIATRTGISFEEIGA